MAVVLLAGCGGSAARRADPGGDTRRSTYADPRGDAVLRIEPGQPLRTRTDLAPAAPASRTLARIGLLADAHVRDPETPARAAFLDRLGNPFTSTFRPQETMTLQVLNAAVRALDAARPTAVVELGDLVDNAQENEYDGALAVLRGGEVRPGSGGRRYEGPQQASDPDPAYYRPGVDPPLHPDLIRDSQRSFRAPGLRARWWPVAGNHDLLVDGEIPATPETEALATGDRALVEPRTGLHVSASEALAPATVDRLLQNGLPGQTRHVTPDPRRRELEPEEAVTRLRSAARTGGSGPLLDYAVTLGAGVRGIVLDSIRRTGGSAGLVTPQALAFLRTQLAAAGSDWVLVFTHQPLRESEGGAAALALLDDDPHTLAVVAAHTHENRIAPRPSPAGGYWQIETDSLADYPQQARMLVVRSTKGGGAEIDTWLLDTAPDPLGDLARELAYIDAQGGRVFGGAGRVIDRNVRLYRAPPR